MHSFAFQTSQFIRNWIQLFLQNLLRDFSTYLLWSITDLNRIDRIFQCLSKSLQILIIKGGVIDIVLEATSHVLIDDRFLRFR